MLIKKIYLYAAAAILFLVIAATFFITKNIYYVDLSKLPKPTIIQVPSTHQVQPIQGSATLTQQTIKIPIYIPVHDTTYLAAKPDSQSVNVTVASLDTAVQYQSKITIKDTTIISYDTLFIKVKYLYPPANKFQITPIIKNNNFVYSEYKPVEYIKPEGFWDKISVGVGFGYGTPLDKVEFKPTVFIGVTYRIKISVF